MWAHSLQKHHWNSYSTMKQWNGRPGCSHQELSCGSAGCERKDNCLAPLAPSASTLLQCRKHWETLKEPPFEGTYCQGPTFTLFSSLIAAGKSIPVTLLSWLGRGDKKTPVLLTYLANCNAHHSWANTQCSYCGNHVDFERKRERNQALDINKLSSHP